MKKPSIALLLAFATLMIFSTNVFAVSPEASIEAREVQPFYDPCPINSGGRHQYGSEARVDTYSTYAGSHQVQKALPGGGYTWVWCYDYNWYHVYRQVCVCGASQDRTVYSSTTHSVT